MRVKKATEKILKELAIKEDLFGFQLWIEVIREAFLEDNIFNNYNIMNIYKKVANKHNLTLAAIERSLRYSRKNTVEDIQIYFDTKNKITNKLFLTLICKKIKTMIEN